ncbi:hypothetical protein HK096_007405, partial [Nowakowskiella sp. JEL0078]
NSDSKTCELQSMDENFVESLTSKLYTIISLRNKTNDHNKAIAGVSQPVDDNITHNDNLGSTRLIGLPVAVYTKIFNLLEELHVEFVVGQPFLESEKSIPASDSDRLMSNIDKNSKHRIIMARPTPLDSIKQIEFTVEKSEKSEKPSNGRNSVRMPMLNVDRTLRAVSPLSQKNSKHTKHLSVSMGRGSNFARSQSLLEVTPSVARR